MLPGAAPPVHHYMQELPRACGRRCIPLLSAHLLAEDAFLLHHPQTFASAVAEAGNRPVWGVGRNLVLQRGEATVARISVARAGPKKKGKRELVG